MQLTLDNPGSVHVITAYDDTGFSISGERYDQSLTVSPEQIVLDDQPGSVDELDADMARSLIERAPDLVIVGSGKSLRFPEIEFSATLLQANIGCEVMDTAAGCRTYNVLAGELRNVIAVLIREPDGG